MNILARFWCGIKLSEQTALYVWTKYVQPNESYIRCKLWNFMNSITEKTMKLFFYYLSLYIFFSSRKLKTDNLVSIWKHLTSVAVNIKTQLLQFWVSTPIYLFLILKNLQFSSNITVVKPCSYRWRKNN